MSLKVRSSGVRHPCCCFANFASRILPQTPFSRPPEAQRQPETSVWYALFPKNVRANCSCTVHNLTTFLPPAHLFILLAPSLWTVGYPRYSLACCRNAHTVHKSRVPVHTLHPSRYQLAQLLITYDSIHKLLNVSLYVLLILVLMLMLMLMLPLAGHPIHELSSGSS